MAAMAKATKFEIHLGPRFGDQFAHIENKSRELILNGIKEQLSYSPSTETRNRKPLRPPGILGAEWELRLGPKNRFRVLYNVNKDEATIVVVGVGVKEGNRLLIAGEEHRG